MVRRLTAALLSIAVFWLGVLALSALGGAQIHEVLFSFAVAITLAIVGVFTFYLRFGRNAAKEARKAQPPQ
jgi:amino acid transporter